MTYAAEVAADAPIARWKLNEVAGTIASDSGSGTANDGTYTGGFTLGGSGMDGLDAGGGTSVKFNGTSGYVDLGSIASKLRFASGAPFTVESWTLFGNGLTSPGAALVTESYSGDGNVRYMLGFHDGGSNTLKPSFGWYNGSWRLVIAPTALTDGVWHHIVGTFDGTQLRLYVDGSLVAGPTTPGGSQPTGTESFYIGRRWDGGDQQYYNGRIDEVAIYDSALSAARVAAHYAALNPSPIISSRNVTQILGEVASSPDSVGRRVTQEFAEVAAVPDVVRRRASQMFVEVAWLPVDWDEWWDVLSGVPSTSNPDLRVPLSLPDLSDTDDAADSATTGAILGWTGTEWGPLTDLDGGSP